MQSLVDRFPEVDADELVRGFVPPHRFGGVRFETYVPNAEHPSQQHALEHMVRFADAVTETGGAAGTRGGLLGGRRRRRAALAAQGPPGVYLDGGYGVGKTHLLAALWHAASPPASEKAYLAFHELTAVIGFLGMDRAVDAFRRFRLLCIDEFELDDVANTLMTVTFLRSIIDGTKVATTSNSLPDRLGEGRFNADDFRREIAAIAAHFEVVRIDGPDYRRGARVVTEALPDDALHALVERQPAGTTATVDDFHALLAHLRVVHPVRFAAMLRDLDLVAVTDMHPIANQGDALLWCQLVDRLYDMEITFAASGCGVNEVFPETYRHGGYRKKYGRCESRLAAMLAELQGS